MVQPGILFLIAGPGAAGLLDGARKALQPCGRFAFEPEQALDELLAGRHVVLSGSLSDWTELAENAPRLVVMQSGAAGPSSLETVQLDAAVPVETRIEQLVASIDAIASRFRLRRVPIDTGRRHTAFLPRDSRIVDASQFLGGRIDVLTDQVVLAADTALIEPGAWLQPGEIGLSSAAFEAFAQPEATEVSIRRMPAPKSRDALRRKLREHELSEPEYDQVIGDIVAGRYSEGEIAGFLVAANRSLTDAEVLSLARVRARYSHRIEWDQPIVVDKHSMGGIPGNRVSLIVVPLVAAHGLTMPKTSSRAITSAAGTADAMECLARVDLSMAEIKQVVASSHACLAWNGRLSHSALDEVMNAITRPLGLDANRWSVASILSKKLSAGATHVVVDVPHGPGARVASLAEAQGLCRLFERVGAGLGLTVAAMATDGHLPIGRGIGPALEARDAMLVLNNHPDAPGDLRAKALTFAAKLIGWDPAMPAGAARSRAETLLGSGAARAAMDAIIAAQGPRTAPVLPARLTHTVHARRSGRVGFVDGFAIAGIARRAGAPLEKGAGVDLLVRYGEEVRVSQPLLTIHAGLSGDLAAAAAFAADSPAFHFDNRSAQP